MNVVEKFNSIAQMFYKNKESTTAEADEKTHTKTNKVQKPITNPIKQKRERN